MTDVNQTNLEETKQIILTKKQFEKLIEIRELLDNSLFYHIRI